MPASAPETQIGGSEATAREPIGARFVPNADDEQAALRIASYNINGINTRLHVLTRWLEEFQPDIVGLQELKCTDEAFPRDAIEALGYSAIWHGQRSWNGVALLSRVGEPVETRRALPATPTSSRAATSRRRCAASSSATCMRRTATRSRARSSITSSRGWTRSRARQDLLDSKVPAILIGDYNVIPTDNDVYKPERWLKDALFAPEAREKYRELVAQGWTDALRHLHPDERVYTFWHYSNTLMEPSTGT